MATRRARGKDNAKKPKRGCLGALLLLMFGSFIGMGLAAAVAVYVNELHLPFIDTPTRDSSLTPEQSRERSKREALEFHDALKRRQTLPLVEDESESGDAEPSTEQRRFVWHLQVGAFAAKEAAEERRAELALAGYAAAIHQGKTASGDVHRVWLGPFNSESDAEELRAKLALEGYGDIPLLKTAAGQ